MADVKIIVSGPVGCGKSAILGEIEILMRALGVPVRYDDAEAAQCEKNMTHADWTDALEMYKPSVVLVEQIDQASAAHRREDQRDDGSYRALCADYSKAQDSIDEYSAIVVSLQKALAFWMPKVFDERSAHDAYLLVGYQGEEEESWGELAQQHAEMYRWLRDIHIGDDPESIGLTPDAKPGLDAAILAAMQRTTAPAHGENGALEQGDAL